MVLILVTLASVVVILFFVVALAWAYPLVVIPELVVFFLLLRYFWRREMEKLRRNAGRP